MTAADLTDLKVNFGLPASCAMPGDVPCPDFDGSGQVTVADLSLLKQNFGLTGPEVRG